MTYIRHFYRLRRITNGVHAAKTTPTVNPNMNGPNPLEGVVVTDTSVLEYAVEETSSLFSAGGWVIVGLAGGSAD